MALSTQQERYHSKKLIDSISSLKRAIGAADHPRIDDTWENGICCVYTTDADSAKILSNFFHKIYYGERTIKQWEGKRTSLKDLVDVKHLDEGCYEIHSAVPPLWMQPFREGIEKTVKTLIAPTSQIREK